MERPPEPGLDLSMSKAVAIEAARKWGLDVAHGLDDFRIRAWTVIRGAYLRPDYADRIKRLL